MTPKNVNSRSKSQMILMDIVGEGQRSLEEISGLGSISQSTNKGKDDSDGSFEGEQPEKKQRKSNTEKFIKFNLADAFEDQADEFKRQSSITDSLKDKQAMFD